jgi:hypothetical protein
MTICQLLVSVSMSCYAMELKVCKRVFIQETVIRKA